MHITKLWTGTDAEVTTLLPVGFCDAATEHRRENVGDDSRVTSPGGPSTREDRRVPGGKLHTNFKLSASGDYLALYNAELSPQMVQEFAR